MAEALSHFLLTFGAGSVIPPTTLRFEEHQCNDAVTRFGALVTALDNDPRVSAGYVGLYHDRGSGPTSLMGWTKTSDERPTAMGTPIATEGQYGAKPGYQLLGDKLYMIMADESLVPEEIVRPADKLLDEFVRAIIDRAHPLSAMVANFRNDSLQQVDEFIALLEQDYGAKRGGARGNLQLLSMDGCLKLEVQVSDSIAFGPELQVAKGLVDDCLREWSADSGPQLRAIVTRAFDVDNGQVNRSALISLTRYDIDDERWREAMQAVRDSMRTIGSKRYVRMYQRPNAKAGWKAISINVAAERG